MEEEVDYTSDGISEGNIFVGGAVNAEMGLDGHFIKHPTSAKGFSPVASLGMEVLEASFRPFEGLDSDRPDLAGILGRNLQPQHGFYTNFPLSSEAQRVGNGLGSFSVGSLVGSEALHGYDLGQGCGGSELSRDIAAAPGGGDIPPEVESLIAPRTGASEQTVLHKRLPKSVKERKRKDKLVLGVDVSMEEVEDFSLTAVVGHGRGNRFGRGFLQRWAAEHWKNLVS